MCLFIHNKVHGKYETLTMKKLETLEQKAERFDLKVSMAQGSGLNRSYHICDRDINFFLSSEFERLLN